MLKNILNFIKRIVFSSFLLYGYNLLINPLNLVIPINVITIFSIAIFGIPAFVSFIFIYLIVF